MSVDFMVWIQIFVLLHFGLTVLGDHALSRLAAREVRDGTFVTRRSFPGPWAAMSFFHHLAAIPSSLLLYMVDWSVDSWVLALGTVLIIGAGLVMLQHLSSTARTEYRRAVALGTECDANAARGMLRLKYPLVMTP